MLNNDYLKGYLSGLDNVKSFLETSYKYSTEIEEQAAFEKTLDFIFEVRENYKQLVKDLNEKSNSKSEKS